MQLFDPIKHGTGIQKASSGSTAGLSGPVHRDKEVPANELVELHVMHMSSFPQVGGMEHGEDVVVVDVELGDRLRLTHSRTASRSKPNTPNSTSAAG